MSSYLITGAGRGLGLELVRQLATHPASKVSHVFATIRGEISEQLKKVVDGSGGRVVPVSMQLNDQASIDKAVASVSEKLGGNGLDVLINNAGIMPFESMQDMSHLGEAFEVNVQSVHRVTVALLPLLRKGKEKKVVNISTTLGSIAHSATYKAASAPAYKITKAALNMMTVQFAQDFDEEGFTFYLVSPGWLKTDLGSEHADLEVDVGAKASLDIIFNKGRESNGKFLNIHAPGWEKPSGPMNNFYDGKEVAW